MQKFTSLGFEAKQFGLHSLRSGGATAAAQAGIADRLFKRHGRWRSEAAKDRYVLDSMSALLSISNFKIETLRFGILVIYNPLFVSLTDCAAQ